MNTELAPLDLAGRMGLAVAMAFVMGLAFEGVYKRAERTSPGGIRTFPMLSLIGILLYLLAPKTLVPCVAGIGAVSIWLYAHIRSEPLRDTPSPGLVVPAANLLAYLLGPTALTQPAWVVVAAAVAAVLLLESRETLHRIVLAIPSDEIYTLGTFLILVGIVLPLVPDRPIVQWTPITPFQAWLALLAVSSLSYASYLMHRYLPRAAGVLWPAVLGGAYSSTATTVALARQQRKLQKPRRDLAAAIVVATAVMFVRIDVVVAFFNWKLAETLLPPLAGLFALAAGLSGWLWLTRRAPETPSETGVQPATLNLPTANPLQLGTALVFAALFVALAVATAWVNRTFGQRGIYALAAVSGLADVDPFVLNLAQGSVAGMSYQSAAAAILVAAASNNVLKAGYALGFGNPRAALAPAVALLALGAAGVGLALVYLH